MQDRLISPYLENHNEYVFKIDTFIISQLTLEYVLLHRCRGEMREHTEKKKKGMNFRLFIFSPFIYAHCNFTKIWNVIIIQI